MEEEESTHDAEFWLFPDGKIYSADIEALFSVHHIRSSDIGTYTRGVPDFDAISGTRWRYDVIEKFSLSDGRMDCRIFDHATRRPFRVTYPPNALQFGREDGDWFSTSVLHFYMNSMTECNRLDFQDGVWKTSFEEGLSVPVLNEVGSLLPASDLPAGTPVIHLDELAVTGVISKTTYVIGEFRTIFKAIVFNRDIERRSVEIRALFVLRNHPHVTPLTHVVLDKYERVMGYTTPYWTGGVLAERPAIKCRWIAQTMMTIDDLAIRHNIRHADLVSENIVVDESDNVRFIDFEYAKWKDDEVDYQTDFDSEAVFLIWEVQRMITHTQRDPSPEGDEPQTPETLQARAETMLNCAWIPRARLDATVVDTKRVLASWRSARLMPRYNWTSFVRSCSFLRAGSTWARALADTVPTWERLADLATTIFIGHSLQQEINWLPR